jgi:hypothetical protein
MSTTTLLLVLAWLPLLAFALAIIPATLAIDGAFDAFDDVFGVAPVNESKAPPVKQAK